MGIYLILLPEFSILHDEGASRRLKVDKRNGTITSYHPNGNNKTIITYKEGEKNGLAYLYDTSGRILLEMPYKNGSRAGFSKKYYTSGNLYALTPYVDNKISGTRKVFYDNGELKAEIPYFESKPGIGLKVFTPEGKPKDLPVMEVRKTPDNIRYEFKMSDCRNVRFYLGNLHNGYLFPNPTLVSLLPSINDTFYISKKSITSGSFNVICECTVASGFPYISQMTIDPNHETATLLSSGVISISSHK